MSRIQALIVKELREHWIALLALLLLLGVAFLMQLLFAVSAKASMTILQPYALFLWTFLVIAGLVLGNRLVVAEYHGRTQLFLEALPVRRTEMIGVKFGLGLFTMLAITGGALGASVLFASRTEPIGGRFLWLLTIRSFTFTLFLWSFLFGMGFLGRFRIPIYLAIFCVLSALSATTDLELERFGPVAVADINTLPLERNVLPTTAVVTTQGIAAFWVALAFFLGTLNEGSMAESLSRRMSQKEKSLIGMLFIAGLAAFAVLDEKKTKAPIDFGEFDNVIDSEEQPVEILYLKEDAKPAAQELLDHLEGDLRELSETLGWEEAPALRVALRTSLDERTFEQAELTENDGVLVRANFTAPDFDLQGFRAYALARVLRERTAERANFEPQAWVLDGFARWWALRYEESPSEPAKNRLRLRALWAARDGLKQQDMVRWFRTRERLGLPVAEALATAGLQELERTDGREKVLKLARALYGPRVPKDARATIANWSDPFPEVFTRETGLRYDEFVAELSATLVSEANGAAAMASLPRGEATLAVRKDQGTIRHLDYGLAFESSPPAAGTPCALLHLPLTPFDEELDPISLLRREHTWPADANEHTWSLPGRYGQGSRVFLALEVESPLLGCPIRLLAERWEIE